MAQHHRLAQPHRAEAAMLVVVQVGAADAAVADADADLARAGLERRMVLDAEVLRRVDDDGAHHLTSVSSGPAGEMRRHVVAHQLAHGLAGLDRAARRMRRQQDIRESR